jgi:phosphate transport system substrate-binding protein
MFTGLCMSSFRAIILPVKTVRLFFFLILLLSVAVTGCDRQPQPGNDVTPSVSIENKGSDTMVNLALAWAEAYQVIRPEIRISVTGGGSGTGIAALINGTVDIANASRRIKPEEVEAARARGTDPIEFVVSRDAIAVIVHLDNPVDHLTLEQISDIYSGKINNWRELGGDNRPIVRLSRETNSGTHIYFLEEVLRLGQPDNRTLFSTDTLLLPSAEGISHEIRQNPNAIGYDGLGYVTHDMKVIAVSRNTEDPFVLPSAVTVNDGSYPISRDLYVYTVGQPRGAVKEFLDWIYTPEAQEIVEELGFVPVIAP